MRLLILVAGVVAWGAEATVQSNVVYGMYSGAALLMDVHKPAKPNGYGVVYISGSGWTAPLAYSAPELKSNGQSLQYAKPLVAAGYTVFTINHRALPRYRYPAAVEDAQRAVRFVRHNAAMFGVRADRIGAAGGSSGGHLVSMLGTLDGKGKPADPDPVEREIAKVQCVVARAAPTNMFVQKAAAFLGLSTVPTDQQTEEYRIYVAASPVSHISSDDAPFLLLHGDKDLSVDYRQSMEFEKALRGAGVPVKLIILEGAGHGPSFPGAVHPPDYLGEMVKWFDGHLVVK